jgi:hypothetical protein
MKRLLSSLILTVACGSSHQASAGGEPDALAPETALCKPDASNGRTCRRGAIIRGHAARHADCRDAVARSTEGMPAVWSRRGGRLGGWPKSTSSPRRELMTQLGGRPGNCSRVPPERGATAALTTRALRFEMRRAPSPCSRSVFVARIRANNMSIALRRRFKSELEFTWCAVGCPPRRHSGERLRQRAAPRWRPPRPQLRVFLTDAQARERFADAPSGCALCVTRRRRPRVSASVVRRA